MAKQKGTANKASFGKPGQLKTITLKIRVSQEYIKTLEEALKVVPFHKGKSKSESCRLAIMEGLQRQIYDRTQPIWQMLQDQIESL